MPRQGEDQTTLDCSVVVLGDVAELDSEVKLDGACRPNFYTDGARLWVGKRLAPTRRRAEILGSLLGPELGVPVPRVGLCGKMPEFVFSEWLDAPRHWDLGDAAVADNYEALGAGLALDALIGNADRNPRNLLIQPLEKPGKTHMCTLWFIDHEAADAGDLGHTGHEDPALRRARACPRFLRRRSSRDTEEVHGCSRGKTCRRAEHRGGLLLQGRSAMTAAEYRVVHFIPNPVSGARVAVAALLRTEGRVRVLSPELTPGPKCLGSVRAATLLHTVRPQLERIDNFGNLPESLGPLFQLGRVQQLPVTENMELALRRLLFPVVMKEAAPRGPHRATQGVSWLERNGVSLDWIGRGFSPADIGLESRTKIATHFVKGNAGLLLMEPIVASARSRADVLTAIDLATTRLRAADHALNSGGFERERGFVAYLLPGSSEDAADIARRALFNFEGAGVVECSNPKQAAAFTGRIRQLAQPLGLH